MDKFLDKLRNKQNLSLEESITLSIFIEFHL